MINAGLLAQLADDVTTDDLRTILGAFHTDMDRLCGQLRDAAAAGDSDRFRRAAHAIAGAAGVVAATALEDCARVAMDGAEPPGPAMEASAAAISALAVAAQASLIQYLQTGALPA